MGSHLEPDGKWCVTGSIAHDEVSTTRFQDARGRMLLLTTPQSRREVLAIKPWGTRIDMVLTGVRGGREDGESEMLRRVSDETTEPAAMLEQAAGLQASVSLPKSIHRSIGDIVPRERMGRSPRILCNRVVRQR